MTTIIFHILAQLFSIFCMIYFIVKVIMPWVVDSWKNVVVAWRNFKEQVKD